MQMFILELTYIAPLERVESIMAGHVDWLKTHYTAGVFIASGRKVPRDGGVILAVAPDRASILEITATDPLVLEGVCEYRVTQFVATTVAEGLEPYRESLAEA
jgi:uncharacterized protein YciI